MSVTRQACTVRVVTLTTSPSIASTMITSVDMCRLTLCRGTILCSSEQLLVQLTTSACPWYPTETLRGVATSISPRYPPEALRGAWQQSGLVTLNCHVEKARRNTPLLVSKTHTVCVRKLPGERNNLLNRG